MTKRLLCAACVLTVLAIIVPTSASAAPAVPMKCDVKGNLLPSASIIARGNITYSCMSTYLGTSATVCPGTIVGTNTSGTCSIGPLTVVRCQFKGTFLPSAGAWKGDLDIECGLPGTPPPRRSCQGSGGGVIATGGEFKGTVTGYCEIPGTE
jgi:hypothetical protein